ncbi:MAG: hypothetical protein LBE09_00740 [Christensenellaceae bacterium]|nr:hypothetical protein [Christensenellaceae bacterium]
MITNDIRNYAFVVQVIALILRTELRNRLVKANLSKKDTLTNVLNLIAMIKGKTSQKGKNKYMNASKKQNFYLKALEIPIIKDRYKNT